MMNIWSLLFVLMAAPVFGQALPIDKWTPPFPTAGERNAADIASWVTVAATVALDAKASWDCGPDATGESRAQCFVRQGLRTGITYGAAFAVKTLVHRTRPCAPDCGIDDPSQSFYSAHTALAFQAIGGPRLAFVLPLAIGTGGLRIAADKHYLTDVLTGAAVGWAVSHIR